MLDLRTKPLSKLHQLLDEKQSKHEQLLNRLDTVQGEIVEIEEAIYSHEAGVTR